MILHHTTVALIFAISIISSSTADNSTHRDQSCGGILQYPFGFSDGSGIRLNCSHDGTIRIGEFLVQNVTSDNILIDLPASCSRPIESIFPLFSKNYALTMQNGLVVHNCSSLRTNCVLPPVLIHKQFGSQNCGARQDNLSCFSGDYDEGVELLSYETVKGSGCKSLFSSIAVESDRNSSVSLEFQTVQLAWWLGGPCRCAENATCTTVNLTNGTSGFRCHCNKGFRGDGFHHGTGCRRVSDCNASKYISGGCGKPAKIGVLIGGIIAGASLMAGLAFICFCIRRRCISLKNRMCAKQLLCAAAGNSCVPSLPYKEIEKATNSFSEKQRLGTGAYGTVYAGKLHNGDWVAIKRIKHRDTDSIEQVMNEIKLLSSVSHPNLVRLLGCCIEEGEQVLVYEFMANGTLSQHLQRERGQDLPWTIRLTIATETAHAIAHLHSTISPPIYHRDIKSSNILLDYNFNSKVADFGLSRLGMTESSHISTAPQGTPGYLDPQYHQNFHLSDKSDVYSFGVVLVEIITALKVVDFSRPHSEVNLAALAIDRIGRGCVDEIIDPFLDLHRDAWTLSSVHKVAELAFRCLAFHRDMRPSMMEVAEELEHIRLSGWAPLEENMSMASSVASACSLPYNDESEKPTGSMRVKAEAASQRLLVPHRAADCLTSMKEVKDNSPVSVHDPWLSEQSSPSTSSLLGNAVQ
ncbi:wall-associated receptor kinase-like 14 [Malania oleifera]|uniref:wall-associated receptor kinase-like 14 n=1 Tax=Malania oleifera TaxID=397392 RepID=UPI0025ADD5D9|nr:wall-associated receptor kinase-like 14 [Malania oleifera]XP_057970251.1 wall-associated receptor kinase-like 14 [Malania oleifera]